MILLIVDDEIITIKSILNGVHWEDLVFSEVLYALSAEEAREILQSRPVDIMLCDIEMKGDNGIELLEWVRAQRMQTECIFLTCHEEFAYAQKALQLEGMDYLLKPVPYDQLQKILAKAIVRIQEKNLDKTYHEFAETKLRQLRAEHGQADQADEKNSRAVVRQVKAYIDGHISEEFNTDFLAKQVYVSTAYLFYAFKKEEGRTLNDYITDTRLFYAKELLKDKDISVTRVAISVGYSNYSYFTKVFKKKYGMTPSQYQREYGQ